VRIGVIGGGTVGGALAATWKAKGREVVVSIRDTVAETARGADVVVLAGPGSAAELIDHLGFEPVDVGGAEATPWVEPLAQLVMTLAYGLRRGPFVYRFQPS
jgi:predicted dinucleotide-binding enzyme